MQVDAYMRVSRIGERDAAGESFIALKEQRAAIESYARQKGIEVIAWHEEMDVSGARMTRPKLRRVMERVKNGDTDGILVAYRSRFARTLLGALEAIRDIEAAGGVFLAADGFDSSTPEGRLGISIMLSFAEYELDRIRGNWKAAVTRANERGIHVSAVPPLGYTRMRGKALRVDPVKAPLVQQAFVLRADGASWRRVADVIGTSVSGARDVITNPAYLGQARGQYGLKNDHAHEPLVAEELWHAAQPGTSAKPKAQTASVGILRSLVRCAACDMRMAISGGRYVCFGHSSTKGDCSAPGSIAIKKLDPWVNKQLGDRLMRGEGWAALEEDALHVAARDALEAARAELESYVTVASTLDADLFRRGLEAREGRVAEARRRLAELPAPTRTVVGKLEDDLTIEDQRAEMARFIDRVTVTKAWNGRWTPVEERVDVVWRGA